MLEIQRFESCFLCESFVKTGEKSRKGLIFV